jgi:hypothetical protein
VKKPLSLRIYECHVGIATEEPKVGTYKEFGTKIIPRIVKQGKTLLCFSFAHFICNYFLNKTGGLLNYNKANKKLIPYLISSPVNWKLFLESKLTAVATVLLEAVQDLLRTSSIYLWYHFILFYFMLCSTITYTFV